MPDRPYATGDGVGQRIADRALLGYSGGVDSAFLAVVGRRVLGPHRFLAVIGRSCRIPRSSTEPPSIWLGASIFRCSKWTPVSWPTRAIVPIRPIAATSARPSSGPDSAKSRRARLRHDYRRHQRRRPDRAPAGKTSGRRAWRSLSARRARMDQARGACGVARAGFARLGRARVSVPVESGPLWPGDHPGAVAAGRGGRSHFSARSV